MNENISPEEKLLRLIKTQKRTTLSAPKPNRKKPRRINFNLLLIASLVYLSVTFAYPLFSPKQIRLPKPDAASTIKEETGPRPYQFYSQALSKRQLFSSAAANQSTDNSIAIEANSIKDISLIGIISGDNPQAIIEDKLAQKTYYLTTGQFAGDFQVENIGNGKISLISKGQRYELFM